MRNSRARRWTALHPLRKRLDTDMPRGFHYITIRGMDGSILGRLETGRGRTVGIGDSAPRRGWLPQGGVPATVSPLSLAKNTSDRSPSDISVLAMEQLG